MPPQTQSDLLNKLHSNTNRNWAERTLEVQKEGLIKKTALANSNSGAMKLHFRGSSINLSI